MPMGLYTAIFGDESTRAIKQAQPLVDKINELEPTIQQLADADFPKKTIEFKERLAAGETLNDILPEAFALVREASVRTLGLRHYDVQLIGGIIIHQGKIAEMRTGEGKTLVATLPAYLNALEGKGVHLVTVNDYLAKRDAQWMGQVYAFLGVSVGIINDQFASYLYDEDYTEDPDSPEGEELDEERDETGSFKVFDEYLRPCTKQEAYQADITYGTNNQFGFDYLRDNTQTKVENLTQRGDTPHHFAIVDEIDSILIDEARVPLILSTQSNESQDLYRTFASVARQLQPEEHYTVDEKLRAIQITDAGIERAEKLLKIDNIYTEQGVAYVHHLESAVKAKALYLRDRDYLIRNGQVMIVDSFTGRVQEGRRWSDGLHQAIEAKEGLAIQAETKTMASITYQNYFKFYKKLSGMTGTAETSSEEFFKVYGLDVVVIPTNKPIARIDNTDFIFQTEQGKFKAIARKIKEIQETGQPVLVGTISVEKSELLSAYLKQEGVKHTVLNAKQHESEGQVVAQAGKKGAVTIATNMAGRGVDIKLGGNPTTPEAEQEIKDLGGLFVLGTERHDARRIDNQLRGRSGRQGDPGETQFYVSLEDPLMKIFGAEKVQGMIGALGIKEDDAIKNKFISKQLEKAQERIEGFNFDSRKHVLEYDDVLSTQRNTIYERRRAILFNNEEYVAGLYNEILELDPELQPQILAKRDEVGDEEKFMELFRRVALLVTDRLWMQHLEVMDRTRQSVNLRAYGQREPIVEYKKEGLRLFRELEQAFRNQVATFMANVKIQDEGQQQNVVTPNSGAQKIGRNDKVTIEKDGDTKEVKYKKVDKYLAEGWKMVE